MARQKNDCVFILHVHHKNDTITVIEKRNLKMERLINMGAPKRKPATIKQKQVEEVNKKGIIIAGSIAVGLIVIISVLLIVL